MPRGYSTTKTSVHFIGYHFVWCPKYRRKVLKSKIADRCRELIYEKSNDLDLKILAIEIMPDHIHLFITGHPKYTPNHIISQIKGYTAHELRKEFPSLKTRMPTLWTRSYFISTHGHVSDKTIKKYIENQKGV